MIYEYVQRCTISKYNTALFLLPIILALYLYTIYITDDKEMHKNKSNNFVGIATAELQ